MEDTTALGVLKSIDENIKKLVVSTTRKDSTLISIGGKFDQFGKYEQTLETPFVCTQNTKYFVYLKRFQTVNSLRNIKVGENDRFRYSIGASPIQNIQIPQGLYDVKSFSNMVRSLIGTTDVEFALDVSTGKTKYTLLNNYTVSWDLQDTFARHLGFSTEIIAGSGFSSGVADLMDEKSIYIALSILTGTGVYFQGRQSNIIHTFAANYAYGDLIDETLNFKIPFLLSHNTFQKIYVECFDQDKKAVNFGGEPFALDILIQGA